MGAAARVYRLEKSPRLVHTHLYYLVRRTDRAVLFGPFERGVDATHYQEKTDDRSHREAKVLTGADIYVEQSKE